MFPERTQEFKVTIDLVAEHTHTCYMGDRSRRHEWGYGCGLCPACDLRAGWRFVDFAQDADGVTCRAVVYSCSP